MVMEHRFTWGLDIVTGVSLVCHWFPVNYLGTTILGVALALVCYLIILMMHMFMRLCLTNS